jgi:hypothetical protein
MHPVYSLSTFFLLPGDQIQNSLLKFCVYFSPFLKRPTCRILCVIALTIYDEAVHPVSHVLLLPAQTRLLRLPSPLRVRNQDPNPYTDANRQESLSLMTVAGQPSASFETTDQENCSRYCGSTPSACLLRNRLADMA